MSPKPSASTDDALERLTAHCMAARAIIEESGTPVMRSLIDLLLFEIGLALAAQDTAPEATE